MGLDIFTVPSTGTNISLQDYCGLSFKAACRPMLYSIQEHCSASGYYFLRSEVKLVNGFRSIARAFSLNLSVVLL